MDRGSGALLDRSWSYLIKNTAILVVALIGLGIPVLVNSLVPSGNLLLTIVATMVALAASAFTTGAVVTMINAVAEGQSVSIQGGLQAGLGKIMPLVGLRLVLMIPIWIILLLATGSLLVVFGSPLGQPGGIRATNMVAVARSIFSFVGPILFFSIILGAISIGAERAIVLENASVMDSVRRGWQLFVANFLDYLVIGLMLLLVSIAIAIAIGCALASLLSGARAPQPDPGLGLAVSGTIVGTLISLVLGALLEVWFSGVWTLAFRRWQGKV